jgi:hypothetical protein
LTPKLIVAHLLMKLPVFCGTGSFTRVRHWPQLNAAHTLIRVKPVYLKPILILSHFLRGIHVIPSLQIFDVFNHKGVEMLRRGIYVTKYSDGMMGIQTLQSETTVVSCQGRNPLRLLPQKYRQRKRACEIFIFGRGRPVYRQWEKKE